MLEARLSKASLLKKILDSVKDLITDVNFDCSDAGIALQAMDSSHVALVVLLLRQQGFEHYRCDRNMSIGMNITSLTKVVKIAGPDDSITLKANDKADVLNLLFESPNEDRMCEFELKLMDIDAEHLGIPTAPYNAVIKMPSGEFARIIRDISVLSESGKSFN
jgi:proliferating cell nuclear antigen